MSKSVIKVHNLSKRYRLGLKEKRAETLMGQLGNLIKSPWQNLKKLQALNKFGIEDDTVFWALKNLNFEVKEGEVLGIIGKNGAGKSTLLKILSQITEPTSGKIKICGRVASLLEVGTGFHPELSGRENIFMNGTILGMSRREIDSKLDDIIEFSGVEKFIDTPVKFYSSGMKVRLGFSVAAHLDPEILIVDEVLAVGDFEFQRKCLGKMEEVSKSQGRTVLFVSHNMGAVKNLTNNSILLRNGIITYSGKTSIVIDEYLKDNKTLNFSKFNKASFFLSITPKYVSGTTAFYLNQDLLFSLKLNPLNPIMSNFRIGFSISTVEEVNLVSGVSNEIECFSDKGLELYIRNTGLVEGLYKLSISIGLGDLYTARNEYEVCKDVLFFNIANIQKSGPSLINWNSTYGSIIKEKRDVNLIVPYV